MSNIILTYTLYLILSLGLTIWVARTLWKNGRPFLLDCFHGNTELTDSVNHLLVVGFYLVNVGFVALFLKIGGEVEGARSVFEALAGKLGVVLLVLGFMHFFNLLVFAKARRAALRGQPPVIPSNHFRPV